MRRQTEKQKVNQIIRFRMRYAERIIENKKNKFNQYVVSDAKLRLQMLKKKYQYCWRTKEQK